MLPYNFITIDGNTGAGKTSLAKLIAEQYHVSLVLEQFIDNPFLPLLYKERDKYGFPAEVYFLMDRIEQLSNLKAQHDFTTGLTIADYTFDKTLLYAKANTNDMEFALFERMFKQFMPRLPLPELFVYVHASSKRLIRNIRKRNRKFEQNVDEAYLIAIEKIYFQYFEQLKHDIPILVLHVDNIDFVENKADFETIVSHLKKQYQPGVYHFKF